MIFNYGTTLCSLISCIDTQYWGIFYFNLGLTLLIIPIQFIFFFIIIYFFYLLAKIKIFSQGMNLWAKKKFIVKYGAIQAYGNKRLNQFWNDDELDILSSNNSGETKEELIELRKEKKRERERIKDEKNKLKFNLISLLTLILTISFLSAYFYELIFM